MEFWKTKWKQKNKPPRWAPRQVIHRPGKVLLCIGIVDAQGTQAPRPVKSTVVRPVGAGDASEAASGKGPEPLAHHAYHARSLQAPLFASSGLDYSASADKSWGLLTV
jgi:hypothetical protein